jgi:hypothetical protein
MKSTRKAKVLTAMAVLAFVSLALGQDEASVDWQAVDEAMGVTGEMNEGNVHKFSLPRSDLELTSSDVVIDPGFALGSWVAFKPVGNPKAAEVTMMGDLVLTEDELNGVISRLQEGGVGQTAIHKHLLNEDPPVWWTHIEGHGDPVALAETVRAALEETGTPLEAQEGGDESPVLGFDPEQLDEIMGHKGEASGRVYKFSVPRAETITAHGEEIPPSMGTANALNFQSFGDGQAAINGDFVMTADEVNGVIQALREHGIQVVSIHNHMMTEQPRLFYMHFWQEGKATELARGLRAALDQVNTAGSE